MSAAVIPIVDPDLIAKYDQAGPRYTSYPTAPQFHEGFTRENLRAEIARTNALTGPPPLSLYFHLPFCESVCLFCGCNVTWTRDRQRPAPYTDLLLREMDALAPQLAPGRRVVQLHWGGGTPTFFSPEQLSFLAAEIRRRFEFAPGAEIGLEVDPRETSTAHMDALADAGFNRLSMGVQDFDPQVQEAVNRLQSFDMTRRVVEEGRARGFKSISVDLIYGLPHQSEPGFARTLDQILSLNPDRIALFNFAYLPEMIRHQKAIRPDTLPTPPEKLRILRRAITTFTDAGYRFIGMDHFARPDDSMARAQDEGRLYRNFQGYTTHAGCDLYAFGVSAISQIGRTYSQNLKDIHSYGEAIGQNGLATHRGLILSDEDLLRRGVIMHLLCHFSLDFAAIEKASGLRFTEHFAEALERLREMRADGLVAWDDRELRITPLGRLLARNIVMAFDAYLRPGAFSRFSRTV
ncbi:MAG: oxygen-independent coproporphyrinogen III oxidase [Verrucomicrobiae bacterium]|nr:oxygen-independent coproporphyrinogen III oxidase [Verrucomicrobiae bacterium]